jgi:hypothetical protein
MIRMPLLGRLGNNLFQFAFGRVLAERHGVPLVMDASWYNHRTWPYVRPLERLPAFRAGRSSLRRQYSLAARLFRKLGGGHPWEYLGKPVFRETADDHSHDPAWLDAPADCVIFGYFQTPRYFQGHESLIRRELDMSALGLEQGQESLVEILRQPVSVAVHVRRTDYVGNRNLHLPGMSYYEEAMRVMRGQLANPCFLIFSDDPDWCRRQFTADDCRVRDGADPTQPLIDLFLMSLASHHIIANSSYSWWAAWLGEKPGQHVIMPDRWFAANIKAPIGEKNPGTWQTLPS